MQLAQQLHDAGLSVFPCRDNKKPAVNKGDDWHVVAQQPPSTLNWPSTLVGLIVPPGCVIIDLDTYKGVTRETVDALIGFALPWDLALIQTTMHGGQHYAFRCTWPVKQGTDIGVVGLDTRSAGKGYVCTGLPYYQPNGFGLFALAYPDTALPELPDACRSLLEHVAPTAPVAELREGDADVMTILSALEHIDPGCDRTKWVKIGLSLRNYFHDDESEGYAVFDKWSSGELWAGDTPGNYSPDVMVHQWTSFKPEGGVGAASLFYEAMQSGWMPPSTLNTAAAFGAGAAPIGVFNDLYQRVVELGGDSRNVDDLLTQIQGSGCNAMQSLLLRNELKALLKDAKLLDKDLTAAIDQRLPSATAPTLQGAYGKNHTSNATAFLQSHYPDGRIMRIDETWYMYDDRCWVEKSDTAIQHEVSAAMAHSLPQFSTVTGTCSMLAQMAYVPNANMDAMVEHVVLFANGVLNIHTGHLAAHDPRHLTTRILPYNYDPYAVAPRWVQFLNEIMEGDQDRILLLQQWMGYMLSPTYQYQKIFLMLGPRRSGKSVIGRIVQHLVGDLNYTGASLDSFAADDFMDSLQGKTVAFSGDTAKRVNRNKVDAVVERLKKISGGDSVDFGRKYKGRMSCRLPTRIMLSANHIPQLFDDSEALSLRMMVLPFEVSFADREDPYLPDALVAEIEGICLWSLQGLASLNQAGRFTSPLASQAEAQFIAESYSPLKVFSESCCVFGGEDITTVRDLYDTYRAWALADQQPTIMGRNTFVSAFKDANRGKGPRYGSHRTGGEVRRGFKGVRVLPVTAPTGPVAAAFTPAKEA